jgi:hypothetical protein
MAHFPASKYIPFLDTAREAGQLQGSDIKTDTLAATDIAADAVAQSELSTETVTVTVAASATAGTATVTASSVVLGYHPTGNQDQFVDNVAISSTTLTITLAAAATADNTFSVILLKV